MRTCRSSRATRVSPIAGSLTARSLDIEGLWALGAEDAGFEHGADAAAQVERRAAAAERGDLVGEAGGAGDGPAGGLVGEALEDEATQGRVQLDEAPVGDRSRLRPLPTGQRDVDQRVEQLRLRTQQRRGPQHVLLGGGVNPLELRDQPPADPVARVGVALVAGVLAPGEAALFAIGG